MHEIGQVTRRLFRRRIRPVQWEKENQQYIDNEKIAKIINFIDQMIEDKAVTLEELQGLHQLMTSYYNELSSSNVTIATQILNGILRGISSDGVITLEECLRLKKWLYENDYLKGHYPFDKIIELLKEVLKDNVITTDESNQLQIEIGKLLNPVEALNSQICEVRGQKVCLTGTFEYGQKDAVKKYIENKEGIVLTSVSKDLDILIVGALACEAYSNGTYGTKIKKAIEYNQKGCNIHIVKEKDFFAAVK